MIDTDRQTEGGRSVRGRGGGHYIRCCLCDLVSVPQNQKLGFPVITRRYNRDMSDEHPSTTVLDSDEILPMPKMPKRKRLRAGETSEIVLPDLGALPSRAEARIANENFKQLIKMRVGVEDFLEIVDKAVEQAKGGNWRARAWLSDYMIGRPAQVIDVQSDQEMRVIVEYVNVPGRTEA
jgi:hypothetical protein